MPACTSRDDLCIVNPNGVLAICLPECDPLTQLPCDEGDGCYAFDDVFICAPNVSTSKVPFELCPFSNACLPGLFCATSEQIGDVCLDGEPCCSPFCDLATPACPDGTTCLPYVSDNGAPAENESLGMCGL